MNDRVAVVYSARYQVELGGAEKLHSFDIRKYAKIYLALNTAGLIRPEDVFVPEPADRDSILLVHTAAYLESLKDSKAVAGYLEAPLVAALPAGLVESQILEPFRYATGGTVLASRLALEHGIGINIGGGYHHAKPDAGEGFCVYNDLAVAIRVLQREGLIRRALLVDLDVHQGNGSAVCFAGDADVFTFSIHEGDIYPIPKETSDLDVELPAGTDDAAYLQVLGKHLPKVFDRARPDIVLLQAGCDTLAGDPLARFRMTEEGVVARDACVVDEAVRRGVPVVVTLGGGYSLDAWHVQFASVRRTIETYGLAANRSYPPRPPTAKEKLYTK
ncbi:MAG: histone deacetylase [Phycisphaerae bacterium]|nr:histone deacetylase [Phycisphaerae bacterium]